MKKERTKFRNTDKTKSKVLEQATTAKKATEQSGAEKAQKNFVYNTR